MSMVFKFRMLSDENDAFVRDYEVIYDMNLREFNDFICNDLGYDPDNISSFFLSNNMWEKQQEFTLIDMDHNPDDQAAPLAMEKVELGNIIHNKRDRLIYLFDMFGDRAYYLELTAAKEMEKGVKYPRTVLSQGEPSNQFDAALNDSGSSIFDEAMGEFNEYEGDDSYDDEYI